MASSQVRITELTDQDPICEQPSGINIKLKRHQLTILAKAKQLEQGKLENQTNVEIEQSFIKTKVGVICDQVGAGKSYVILSLALDDSPVYNDPTILSCNRGLVVTSTIKPKTVINTSLLVIPHNLCSQWIKYITQFKPDLSYYLVTRNKHFEKIFETDITPFKLIVVTCTMYNRLASYIEDKRYTLRRIFYDEVDTMSIPACTELDSVFHWFITASYGNLLWPRGQSTYDYENRRYITTAQGLKNSGFIKGLFCDLKDSLDNNVRTKLFLKNNSEYVQNSLQLPPIDIKKIQCKSMKVMGILNGLVDNHIMNCLNVHDIQGAMQYIHPGNRQSEDSIISLLIDKLDKQVNNYKVRLEYTNLMEFDDQADKEAEIQRLNTKMKETQDRIQAIQDRVKGTNTCPICYDDISTKTVLNCCSNSFCFKCINTWMVNKKNCPMCKQFIDRQENMFVIDEDKRVTIDEVEEHSEEIHESNDKMVNLENIIKTAAPNSKFLIFSSLDHPFNEIGVILDRHNKKQAYLKGNNHVIKNIVDNYKSGDTDVLLINTQYYGSGMNLENTTDVIMFHKFDTEIEKQVIGRAQRYGRNDSLRVWYLLYKNEL